jgi:hypothetical protein
MPSDKTDGSAFEVLSLAISHSAVGPPQAATRSAGVPRLSLATDSLFFVSFVSFVVLALGKQVTMRTRRNPV